MLSLEQLKIIGQTPNENDISLQLLAEFYEINISNRIYELEMEDGTLLVFSAENYHFPHLIGLHKFIDRTKTHSNRLMHSKKQLKTEKGFYNLKNAKITLQDLKSVGGNTKRYNSYKKRILNFPFSYQLLRRSIFLSYDKEKVHKNTHINGDYIFVNDIGNDKLHFFFINCAKEECDAEYDELQNDDSVVPITFIVTKKNDLSFVCDQDVLVIKKIVIKNLTTEKILEEYDFTKVSEVVVKGD